MSDKELKADEDMCAYVEKEKRDFPRLNPAGHENQGYVRRFGFLAGYDARNDEVKREFKEGMLYAATILMNASGGDAEKYAEFIRFAARENK